MAAFWHGWGGSKSRPALALRLALDRSPQISVIPEIETREPCPGGTFRAGFFVAPTNHPDDIHDRSCPHPRRQAVHARAPGGAGRARARRRCAEPAPHRRQPHRCKATSTAIFPPSGKSSTASDGKQGACGARPKAPGPAPRSPGRFCSNGRVIRGSASAGPAAERHGGRGAAEIHVQRQLQRAPAPFPRVPRPQGALRLHRGPSPRRQDGRLRAGSAARRGHEREGSRPRFAYLSPFLRQSKQVAWDYLRAAMGPSRAIGASVHETELRVDYPNGGQVRLFGADNPTTRCAASIWTAWCSTNICRVTPIAGRRISNSRLIALDEAGGHIQMEGLSRQRP